MAKGFHGVELVAETANLGPYDVCWIHLQHFGGYLLAFVANDDDTWKILQKR